MPQRAFFTYLCLLGLLLPQRLHAAWTLTIPPYEDECFLIRTPSSMKAMKLLMGDYELIDDRGAGVSAEPLLVYIIENGNGDKIVWRSKPGESSASFRVPISGTSRGYWMCFQNSSHGPDNREKEQEHPDHITRLVGFSFRLESIYEKPAPLVFTSEHADEWRVKSAAVEHELRVMENHQGYMRVREADHRFLVESTFVSTLSWTLAEAAVVVLMSVGQVIYFRRFLERKTLL